MMPASAVCALVFAHPKSKYFAVGHINEDQAQSYAKRKNISLDAAKDALRPILNE
jgi:5-methyltetrahydrofolate--homocysteine methyltransferase